MDSRNILSTALAVGAMATAFAVVLPWATAIGKDTAAQVHAAEAASATVEQMMASGESLYMTHCAACHQPTGQGLPGAFPPLADSELRVRPAHHVREFAASCKQNIHGRRLGGEPVLERRRQSIEIKQAPADLDHAADPPSHRSAASRAKTASAWAGAHRETSVPHSRVKETTRGAICE